MVTFMISLSRPPKHDASFLGQSTSRTLRRCWWTVMLGLGRMYITDEVGEAVNLTPVAGTASPSEI